MHWLPKRTYLGYVLYFRYQDHPWCRTSGWASRPEEGWAGRAGPAAVGCQAPRFLSPSSFSLALEHTATKGGGGGLKSFFIFNEVLISVYFTSKLACHAMMLCRCYVKTMPGSWKQKLSSVIFRSKCRLFTIFLQDQIDFSIFIYKSVRHRSRTQLLRPFRFWLKKFAEIFVIKNRLSTIAEMSPK